MREDFEKFGFVFGENDPHDPLFVPVTMPEGWKKQATDHSMWSDLLDAQGRKRASIFYKAAFYDRDAFIGLNRRYSARIEPVGGWEDPQYRLGRWYCVVRDADEIIWRSESIEPEPNYDKVGRESWLAWMNKKDALANLGAMSLLCCGTN